MSLLNHNHNIHPKHEHHLIFVFPPEVTFFDIMIMSHNQVGTVQAVQIPRYANFFPKTNDKSL